MVWGVTTTATLEVLKNIQSAPRSGDTKFAQKYVAEFASCPNYGRFVVLVAEFSLGGNYGHAVV